MFQAFEVPFNLGLSGFEDEDIDLTVEVIVDAQTHFMQEVWVDVYASDDVATSHTDIDVIYEDFNEIEEFEVEEEIYDELGL